MRCMLLFVDIEYRNVRRFAEPTGSTVCRRQRGFLSTLNSPDKSSSSSYEAK